MSLTSSQGSADAVSPGSDILLRDEQSFVKQWREQKAFKGNGNLIYFGGWEEQAGFRGIARVLVKMHHRGWERNLGRKGQGRLVLSSQESDFCLFNENYEADLSFPLTLK